MSLGPTAFSVRPACARDRRAFEEAHEKLLPVAYKPAFFTSVLCNRAPFTAILASPIAEPEHLTAFATARTVPLREAPYNDRQCIGRTLGCNTRAEGVVVMYVLTIGVQPEYQRQGLASTLMRALLQVRHVTSESIIGDLTTSVLACHTCAFLASITLPCVACSSANLTTLNLFKGAHVADSVQRLALNTHVNNGHARLNAHSRVHMCGSVHCLQAPPPSDCPADLCKAEHRCAGAACCHVQCGSMRAVQQPGLSAAAYAPWILHPSAGTLASAATD